MTRIAATPTPAEAEKPARRGLPFLLAALKSRIDRLGLPARLDRLSDHQLRDAGLHRGDIDWLRTQGTASDPATELAIRADLRAGNW